MASSPQGVVPSVISQPMEARMIATLLSLLALVALGVAITADEITAACALVILIVAAIWVRSRSSKLK